MDQDLVDHALSLILDDIRICEWVTLEVGKRLKRKAPQDYQYWAMYTSVMNELLEAARKKNEPYL